MRILTFDECSMVTGGTQQTPPPPTPTPVAPSAQPPGSPTQQQIDEMQRQIDQLERERAIDDCEADWTNFGTASGAVIGAGAAVAATPVTAGVSLTAVAGAGVGGAGIGNLAGNIVGQVVCPAVK